MSAKFIQWEIKKKSGNSKSLIPPVVIGHEFSGLVCDVGKNGKDFTIGD